MESCSIVYSKIKTTTCYRGSILNIDRDMGEFFKIKIHKTNELTQYE